MLIFYPLVCKGEKMMHLDYRTMEFFFFFFKLFLLGCQHPAHWLNHCSCWDVSISPTVYGLRLPRCAFSRWTSWRRPRVLKYLNSVQPTGMGETTTSGQQSHLASAYSQVDSAANSLMGNLQEAMSSDTEANIKEIRRTRTLRNKHNRQVSLDLLVGPKSEI